jgi:hypothetical protein
VDDIGVVIFLFDSHSDSIGNIFYVIRAASAQFTAEEEMNDFSRIRSCFVAMLWVATLLFGTSAFGADHDRTDFLYQGE